MESLVGQRAMPGVARWETFASRQVLPLAYDGQQWCWLMWLEIRVCSSSGEKLHPGEWSAGLGYLRDGREGLSLVLFPRCSEGPTCLPQVTSVDLT